uniref:Uncharacterized protein n=1 Tax=Aegilops tauschii subsp. strangulata TaxID=200361 RepID=A0A453GER1_AEGTS
MILFVGDRDEELCLLPARFFPLQPPSPLQPGHGRTHDSRPSQEKEASPKEKRCRERRRGLTSACCQSPASARSSCNAQHVGQGWRLHNFSFIFSCWVEESGELIVFLSNVSGFFNWEHLCNTSVDIFGYFFGCSIFRSPLLGLSNGAEANN